jgi:hypothetical protein
LLEGKAPRIIAVEIFYCNAPDTRKYGSSLKYGTEMENLGTQPILKVVLSVRSGVPSNDFPLAAHYANARKLIIVHGI